MQRMLRPLTPFALALAVLAPAPHASAQDPPPEAPVVLAAGDIANCKILVGAVATGRLLDQAPSATILTLGDNAYESGTANEFAQCFGPTWGRNKDRIRPVLGNHDIRTKNGGPFYEYFGERAGPKGRGYYSFEIGSWHVIAMNSAIDTGPKSKQLEWLTEDLAAHPSDCILAYWHIPLFSSGPHGPSPQMIPAWKALLAARADVVLNGHDHDYERFAPQDEFGKATPLGIREFVVGTGGGGVYDFVKTSLNSEVRSNASYGVIKLTLKPGAYDWEFLPATGTFTDKGSGSCTPKP
jgi:hypothetical protein